jgi:hypothetical protein
MKTHGFHKTNFGSFGEGLPCDLDGYVHTTAKGWMTANMDGLAWQGYSRAAKYERCKEMAAEAREALKESTAALAKWRAEN